jgi:hypothetical protein
VVCGESTRNSSNGVVEWTKLGLGIKPLEKFLGLVFGRHVKLNMHVHTPRTTQSRIQRLFVVGGDE